MVFAPMVVQTYAQLQYIHIPPTSGNISRELNAFWQMMLLFVHGHPASTACFFSTSTSKIAEECHLFKQHFSDIN
jgi:hypothetical protein